MKAERYDYYQTGGMNVDVNQFLMKDSELLLCNNMYSKNYGSKTSRFGYQLWLDNPDNQAVRSLYFSRYGNTSFILRVSNQKLYRYAFTGSTWGSPVLSLTCPETQIPQFVNMAGIGAYTHMVDGTDPYRITTDGTTWTDIPFISGKNQPSYLSAWRARIHANSDQTRFAFSTKQFDLYVPNPDPGQTNRPWNIPGTQAANDPAAWGIPDQQNAGFYGDIVGITNGLDRVNIYYQNGIVKWNGQQPLELPYGDNVIPNMITTSNESQADYLVGFARIYRNDGSQIQDITFGVKRLLEDTFNTNGVSSHAFAYSYKNFIFFYFGNMTLGSNSFTNAMLVYNEDYNEWYIWELGHDMCAMGTYTDASGNTILVSGDINGNTYVWDKSYTSDAGIPIAFRMRSKYFDFGSPDKSKTTSGTGDKSSVSMNIAQGARFGVAADYSGEYHPQTVASGYVSKYVLHIPKKSFKTLSVEVSGASADSVSEFYGHTIKFLDQETRPGNKA